MIKHYFFKLAKKEHLIPVFLYLLAVIFRWYMVSDYNFPFWFDPGRDALVSRSIIENRDIKIQGPTAAGTNDSIYHGVIYYYVIGLLYTLFAGDPQLVLNTLILLSSLGVIFIYWWGKDWGGKKVGILAGLFYAFSLDAARANTWLSNPIFASALMPLFFYIFFLVFYQRQLKLLPWLGLILGLIHQSVILFAPLWGLVLVGFYYAAQYQNLKISKNWQLIGLSLAIYILTISTMILAQFKAYLAGIFTFSKLLELSLVAHGDSNGFWHLIDLYLVKFSHTVFPIFPLLSICLAIFVLAYFVRQKSNLSYIALLFFSPLFLLTWYFKNTYHVMMGIESLLYVLLAVMLSQLYDQKRINSFVISIFMIFFIAINFWAMSKEITNKKNMYYLPQGAFLTDQLNLIDQSYQLANGADFSISSLTNPYGYNSLWSYLYSWYGYRQYGYLPHFFGPTQDGIYGEKLLPETTKPYPLHVSIYEPPEGIPSHLEESFTLDQDREASTGSAEYKFGTLRLVVHEPTQ